MQIIGFIFGVLAVIPWVIVLIKMFEAKGALHVILGALCGLYAFIWGWMNADKLGIKKVMLIWTGLVVVGMLFGGIFTTLPSLE